MFLERAVKDARKRVREMAELFSPHFLEGLCAELPPPPSFSEAILRNADKGVAIIAEVKRRSPSRGDIKRNLRVAETVRAYRRGGACAVSVLTEPRYFGGSLLDLAEASTAVDIPVMRKDFILDRYQLLEARAAGAAAVLLIAAALDKGEISSLLAKSKELGLECLVEIRDEKELEKALRAGAEIIGVNNRDLHTLEVDTNTVLRLAPLIPDPIILVAESGYRTHEDLQGLRERGVDAVLVGEALSGSEDPERALLALRGVEEKSDEREKPIVDQSETPDEGKRQPLGA